MTATVLVLAGYGLNCEEETLHAFKRNGIDGKVIHINDLIDNPKALDDVQILAVPGGFSYGDDTGSGNAFAQKMKLALWEPLKKFVSRDTLTIGICNGCQILSNLGLVPGFGGKYGERLVAVTHNLSARYQCRWIDVKADSASPWLEGIETMHIPVAHGEGRFMMEDTTLAALKKNGQIAATYVKPDGSAAEGEFPHNPNGSLEDIAAITDQTGRVLAIMPHPERGMFTWQRDDYPELKDAAQRKGETLPEEADGMQIFQNAARYFEVAKVRKTA
ncbi:MAG: phosphoribosylformylglycinamidine synthase subunit PurQ [Alphaproteobacteria bacterium]|nr:phosphoribosylformylglycinamidine synthase subunit PurQ [Alphaproteobacteria bacterium]